MATFDFAEYLNETEDNKVVQSEINQYVANFSERFTKKLKESTDWQYEDAFAEWEAFRSNKDIPPDIIQKVYDNYAETIERMQIRRKADEYIKKGEYKRAAEYVALRENANKRNNIGVQDLSDESKFIDNYQSTFESVKDLYESIGKPITDKKLESIIKADGIESVIKTANTDLKTYQTQASSPKPEGNSTSNSKYYLDDETGLWQIKGTNELVDSSNTEAPEGYEWSNGSLNATGDTNGRFIEPKLNDEGFTYEYKKNTGSNPLKEIGKRLESGGEFLLEKGLDPTQSGSFLNEAIKLGTYGAIDASPIGKGWGEDLYDKSGIDTPEAIEALDLTSDASLKDRAGMIGNDYVQAITLGAVDPGSGKGWAEKAVDTAGDKLKQFGNWLSEPAAGSGASGGGTIDPTNYQNVLKEQGDLVSKAITKARADDKVAATNYQAKLNDILNAENADLTNNIDKIQGDLDSVQRNALDDINSASIKATSTIRDSAIEGNKALDDQYTVSRADLNTNYGNAEKILSPYVQAGDDSLKQLQELLNDPDRITKTAAYKFRMNQGTEAVQNSSAAAGMLLSGNTLKGLTEFGQGLASTELDKAVGQYQSLVNTGLSAATTTSGLRSDLGKALAGISERYGAGKAALSQWEGGSLSDIYMNAGGASANVRTNIGSTKANIGSTTYNNIYDRSLATKSAGEEAILKGNLGVNQGLIDSADVLAKYAEKSASMPLEIGMRTYQPPVSNAQQMLQTVLGVGQIWGTFTGKAPFAGGGNNTNQTNQTVDWGNNWNFYPTDDTD